MEGIYKMSDKRLAYPVVLTPAKEGGYCVEIPDFGTHTQGENIADALYMAQEAIEMMGVFWEDEGRLVPQPSDLSDVEVRGEEIKTLVAVDFKEYRRKTEKRLVKKTLSIPSWLNASAEEAGVNFSATLQEALKAKLGV